MGQSQGRIDGQGLPNVQMYPNNGRLQNAVDALNSAHVMTQAKTSMKRCWWRSVAPVALACRDLGGNPHVTEAKLVPLSQQSMHEGNKLILVSLP